MRMQDLCWRISSLIARANEVVRNGSETAAIDQFRVPKHDFKISLEMEAHWRDLIEHSGDWWDNRLSKQKPRAPDFRHKSSRQAL